MSEYGFNAMSNELKKRFSDVNLTIEGKSIQYLYR